MNIDDTDDDDALADGEKKIPLFTPDMTLLKKKPKKESAVDKFHENFKQEQASTKGFSFREAFGFLKTSRNTSETEDRETKVEEQKQESPLKSKHDFFEKSRLGQFFINKLQLNHKEDESPQKPHKKQNNIEKKAKIRPSDDMVKTSEVKLQKEESNVDKNTLKIEAAIQLIRTENKKYDNLENLSITYYIGSTLKSSIKH